ncbi:hypothetical protein [Parendozoicomonas haliclonae]|uniref:Uncharacterized protein n=1 Tax=Parendozoicomonas haliclonae TaxID=1960125 RepID=A0A1X7AH06_9GAMM|nr:hypothetical protein [Parendozoicomonas haliclonae]SMA41714.1 hypothetical protein EHSB41UT_01311 [Parendozoicomonas haliclonae]
MKTNKYGFYFETQGRSGDEGPIDPAQQYFEGSHADHAVVRETGQNTLDNPRTDAEGPIRMVFELATMNTKDIPGIEGLRKHLDAVAEQTEHQQGHDRMVKAAALSKEETIPVLRISDYNTTGLTGNESLASKGSPISRLTRGKGGSSDDERGGSFGIGSAVGPMASDLCTVIYTSIPEDTRDSVMAGYTRLATHSLNDVSYRAEGYFTKLDCQDDFKYQRPAPKIEPFSERTEPGTDIYILGYRMTEKDPQLERVRDAMIDNFMAAIKEGHLVVEGIAQGNHWTLDADTLPKFAKNLPEANAFYQALQDPNPAETTITNVGNVRLYINIDDSLEKKLHTVTMRAPLMKIDTFKHNSLSAKYAAVLVCDSTEGNKYLRQLEPPQHHEWDAARDPLNGKKVLRDLKTFVREALKERISTDIGDEVTIDGLSRFLPTESMPVDTAGDPSVPALKLNEEDNTESSSVSGSSTQQNPTVIVPRKKVRVNINHAAQGDGEERTKQGKSQGGSNKNRGKEVGFPGQGQEGEGKSRIPSPTLFFRSWCEQNNNRNSSVMVLAIKAEKDVTGDLELMALGTGGEPEEGYNLPILRAAQHLYGKSVEIEFTGNTLKNLTLEGGRMTRIEIHMPAGERYRLGVA